MKVEFRSDHVHITGYVNAVERNSRPMRAGDGRFFVEKIHQGAFQRAIEANPNVQLKHNHKRVVGDKQNFALREDNIGLRCEVDLYDKILIERARKKELVGWSFGFIPLDYEDTRSELHGIDFERTIKDMKLNEVSLIDIEAVPCYSATSVEVRSEEDPELFCRAMTDGVDYEEKKEESEETEEQTEEETEETEDEGKDDRACKGKNELARAKITLLELV